MELLSISYEFKPLVAVLGILLMVVGIATLFTSIICYTIEDNKRQAIISSAIFVICAIMSICLFGHKEKYGQIITEYYVRDEKMIAQYISEDVVDFSYEDKKLTIYEKGRAINKELLELSCQE